MSRWHADREIWLRQHGIEDAQVGWKAALQKLELPLQREFMKTFSERWHRQLDAGHGTCPLRDPNHSKAVSDSLHKFDGDRYQLTDFIVMPNHVHILAAFKDESGMLEQCASWKHFTACELNKPLKRTGRFWQQDGFDHLVRTTDQFDALRKYIANNPAKARLKVGELAHFSRDLSQG